MATASQQNERLAKLTAAGTSVWLDMIRRSMIESGELARLMEEDSLRGVTSNPAILEKSILGSSDYDEHLEQLAGEGKSGREVYRYMAIKDIQMAADVLRPVYDESGGQDGYVSLEVAPRLAHDTEGTIEQARMYWDLLDRPNVMIKIPGTDAGLPAIEEMIYEGKNINVTLLFSVEAHRQVMDAFIRGLERRHEEGRPLDVHSVASFFVSRVDTEVDKRLDEMGNTELQGIAAVANARAAYQAFKEVFGSDRFAKLREAGAPVQRPLWASTGVKNPHYAETKYVDELVGPDTVNTMPMPTLLAVAERGEITGATADIDPSDDLKRLADAGIDMKDVTDQLLREGVEAFLVPMEKLLAGIESKREAIVTGRPTTIESVIPDDLEPRIAERVKQAAGEDVAQRVWKKDESLWGGPGVPEIGNRLGWLTITEVLREEVPRLEAFRRRCMDDGLTDAVLLGMGGSSLAPEVFRRSFPEAKGMKLHVLDSTDAGAIRDVEHAIDLSKTLFIVSSKSGGTIETLSQFRYFYERLTVEGVPNVGSHFVTITDPGSKLLQIAEEHGFRRVFVNDPDIGGRYSALSFFGLVPAALMGVDIGGVLDAAQVAEQRCQGYDKTTGNSGLWLGCTIGELALAGRDKATFVVDAPISAFGLWVEQLIAESTGKEGKGILPVADEPLGAPDHYGEDRVFIHLRNAGEPDAEADERVKLLAKAGHPVITVPFEAREDLGRIFFISEFAVAVAGWVLGINPFDQPNVQEAKDNTAKVLERYESDGRLPELEDADDDALGALVSQAAPPHYVALMGYVKPSEELDRAIASLRVLVRDHTRATTTFGYGPRFLHSTGQLHKGGAKTGVFLQILEDDERDIEIPGAGYTFNTLKNAQAIGDLETLRSHGLPAERVRLDGDPARAVEELTERLKGML